MLPSEYCWAFHSDCKEELLTLIPGMNRNEPKWSELKAFGVGWWIRSNDLLRRTIEKVSISFYICTILNLLGIIFCIKPGKYAYF